MANNPHWEATKLQSKLAIKWGDHDVPELDQARAEAMGLKEMQHKVGYSKGSALPDVLQHPGACARYIRRTAELLLRASDEWKDIEERTRKTSDYFATVLSDARITEESYRTAATVLLKMHDRLQLISVWQRTCPGLRRSKERELEIAARNGESITSTSYRRTLAEKQRIDILFDAVVSLKELEEERPICPADVFEKYEIASKLAATALQKIHEEEARLAEKLTAIGDGGETTMDFVRNLEESLASSELRLANRQLLTVPTMLFGFEHLELLDLGNNAITELTGEVKRLKSLKKLYLNGNKLRNFPNELCKLEPTLVLLSCANNPLEPATLQLYLSGLPILMEHLRLRARTAFMEANRKPATLNAAGHAVGISKYMVKRESLKRSPRPLSAYDRSVQTQKVVEDKPRATPTFDCFPKRVKNQPVRPFILNVPRELEDFPHMPHVLKLMQHQHANALDIKKYARRDDDSKLNNIEAASANSRARTSEGGARGLSVQARSSTAPRIDIPQGL